MILFPIIYNLTHNSNFLPDIEEYFGKIAIKPPDTLFHIQQGIRGFLGYFNGSMADIPSTGLFPFTSGTVHGGRF